MTTSRYQVVSIDHLVVKPQVRQTIDKAAIDRMATSIAQVGLQQPLLCARQSDGTLLLIEGHTRLAALKLLGRTEVPVILQEGMSNEPAVLASQLVCNLRRQDLNAIDKAEGIGRLVELSGGAVQATANALGLSPAAVTKAVALGTLPDGIRARVRSGEIPADSAYLLARVSDPAMQAELAKRVVAKSLTRDGLAREVKRLHEGKGSLDEKASRAHRHVRPKPAAIRCRVGDVTLIASGKALSMEAFVSALESLVLRAKACQAASGSLEMLARDVTGDEAARSGKEYKR